MKWPLVVKSPGSILAMIISPFSRRERMVSSSVLIVSHFTPKSPAPCVNSDQAVPAPET